MAESTQPQWLLYAASSGACAALNGVFAKLTTTTSSSSSWATTLADILPMQSSSAQYIAEIITRSAFFALNMTFNAIMWTLFTRALTLANSTVRVSVINTSVNFVITAVLGRLVFGESLPGLWWVGAALLVVGSVIIGRRDEGTGGARGSMSDVEVEAKDSPRVLRSRGDGGSFELDEKSQVRQRKPK